MIKIAEPYRSRPIRFLEYWSLEGWRLKVYGIAYQGDVPSPALVQSARQITRQRLVQSAGDTNHYYLGFVGIHAGKTGNFIFVDWWADENELHHHVYVGPTDAPERLEYRTPTGLTACVWDLQVLCHERNAWLEAILKNHPQPDAEVYLQNCFEGDV